MATESELRDYLRRTTAELRSTREQLRVERGRASEPVAVVSLACRFPGGVRSPEDLWDVVVGNREVVGDFPTDRGWDLERVAELYGQVGLDQLRGGFIDDVADFDAEFFGISPREALAMAPQQRLVLQLTADLLERTPMDSADLVGQRVGVFIGADDSDYAQLLIDPPDELRGYIGTGTLPAVISGRVAYQFGFVGAAVTVDTACSSSLVAVAQAVAALRSGACDAAVAGGVAVLSTPGVFTEFARQRGLSADGRCRSFAAAADGTGFAEGAGLVLLQRLSDARTAGHPILALIRGAAINSDGASNGLTAPSGPAQQAVIRAALDNAGLHPADIDAIEAHGTGTRLGDPIEAAALHAVYGPAHTPDQPLHLGSVKSNIGHTQAAAGIAGIIKMTHALHHATLPASLHLDTPNPHIDLTDHTLHLLTTNQPWPTTNHPRRAGISSFGVSGTNAHLILEQPPTNPSNTDTTDPNGTTGTDTTGTADSNGTDAAAGSAAGSAGSAGTVGSAGWPGRAWAAGPDAVWSLPLSAKTPWALRQHAHDLLHWLDTHPDPDLAELAGHYTRRSLHRHRAVITTPTTTDLRTALTCLTHGQPHPHLTTTDTTTTDTTTAAGSGTAAGAGSAGSGGAGTAGSGGLGSGGIVFCYTGQGSQYPGMGTGMAAAWPAFAADLADIAALFDHLTPSLHTVLTAPPDSPTAALIHRTDYTQPALFTIHTALTRHHARHGITPTTVTGHSIGEISAAHTAGILTLTDAATLITHRSQLMNTAPPGIMIAANTDPDTLTHLITDLHYTHHISIAATNNPTSTVIAGDPEPTRHLAHTLTTQGIRTHTLPVSHAFHSHHLDPLLPDYHHTLTTLTLTPPHTPLISTLTTQPLTPTQATNPTHWTHHTRQPVNWTNTTRTILTTHPTHLLEIGPGNTLTTHTHHTHHHDTHTPTTTNTHTDTPTNTRHHTDTPPLPTTLTTLNPPHHNPTHEPTHHHHTLATLTTTHHPPTWPTTTPPPTNPTNPPPTHPHKPTRHWPTPHTPVAIDERLWQRVTHGDLADVAEEFGIDPGSRAGLGKLLDQLVPRYPGRLGDTEAEPVIEVDDEPLMADPSLPWRALPADERRNRLRAELSTLIAIGLGEPELTIEPHSVLLDIGLTSVMVLEVGEEVRRRVGIEIAPGAIYELETLQALADHLSDRLDG